MHDVGKEAFPLFKFDIYIYVHNTGINIQMIFFTKESELNKFINYIILENQQNMSVL